MRRLFPLIAAVLLLGCKNDCQKLCDEMADYAEECGLPVDREDIKECRAAQSNGNVEKEGREACESARPGLREEWTCDDLEDYFLDSDEGDAGGGTGGEDSGDR
ncbi:MAG: hypothetical protein VX265_05385 [Myxococcota bacterium]|nr:hypothetical protein [Myxococcota bacterium]MEC8423968.1 hypothetical protein [Myxococcota bacterium]